MSVNETELVASILEASALLEAQSAEIERLRKVLADIAEYGDDPDHPAVAFIAGEARNALENKP